MRAVLPLFFLAAQVLACARGPLPGDAGAPASAALRSDPLPSASAPPPAAPEIRYLALGDSFTIGTGSSPDQAFPARLAARLRARGQRVALENLGVNGFTTEDLIQVELPRVKAFAPTLVTLAVGANDLVRGSPVEPYRAQLRRIFAGLAAAGVAADRIVALPQPDWSASPVAGGFGDRKKIAAGIAAFNDALREEATAAGARWVDLYPLMQRQARAGMVAGDGLHPAAQAHDEWAEELAKKIGP